MKKLLSLASLLILGLGTAVYAADKDKSKDKPSKDKKTEQPVQEAKLADFKLGAAITGPAADLAKTEGKAVVIEAWGVHCGPCLASLPHMQELAKARKNDTIFIGAHSQQATDDEVKEVVKKNKLTYAIVNGVNGPVNFSGIPHAFVFDAAGKMLYSGHPADAAFDAAVRKASASAKVAK